MKSKKNMKSIIIMAALSMAVLFFINISFAKTDAKVSVETANLRESADSNSKILEQLSLNEKVEVLEKIGDWYQVKAKGKTGYLRQDLISVEEEKVDTNTSTSEDAVETTTPDVTETIEQTQNTENITDTKENETKKIAENTKLKIVPSINATEIIEVKQDEEVVVMETINDWVCIQVGNTKGWIRKEKLKDVAEETNTEKTPEAPTPVEAAEPQEKVLKTLYISSDRVNVRKEANTNSEIVTKVTLNTAVDVYSEANGWSKVKVNGVEGYISSSLLSSKKKETTTTSRGTQTTRTKQEEQPVANAPVSGKGSDVVAYAKQFIGTPYKYGGTSPSTGFDCSGFTSYVYSHFGVGLPRTSGGQGSVGTAVSRSQLAPGDLVIYSGHVAIYVGGGQVIHSPKPGRTVCIVPINQAAGRYIGARRVI